MAWIKLKSSVTNKTISMTKSAYENFHKSQNIFTVVDETPKKPVKTQKVKEEENKNGSDE